MANNGRSKTTRKGSFANNEWKLVSYRPLADEQVRINALHERMSDPRHLIGKLVDETTKISISYSERFDSYIVSLSDKDPKSVNYQTTLSTFHVDPIKAMCALTVALEVCGSDPWTSLEVAQQAYDY